MDRWSVCCVMLFAMVWLGKSRVVSPEPRVVQAGRDLQGQGQLSRNGQPAWSLPGMQWTGGSSRQEETLGCGRTVRLKRFKRRHP